MCDFKILKKETPKKREEIVKEIGCRKKKICSHFNRLMKQLTSIPVQ